MAAPAKASKSSSDKICLRPGAEACAALDKGLENKLSIGRGGTFPMNRGRGHVSKKHGAMKNVEALLKKIENRRLLVVFPHPDDESVMAGGLIIRALALGYKVTVICLTKGGRGKIHINGNGKSAEEIRESEFGAAMEALGVTDYHVWSFQDGGLRKSRSWQEKLTRLIKEFRPGLVVSYDHSGVTGHPDHIAASRTVFEVVAGLPGDARLWWPSFSGKLRKLFVDPRVTDLLPAANLRLDLTAKEALKKWRAISAHRSQGGGRLSMWPVCLGFLLKYRYEEFAEADLRKNYDHKYVKFYF